MTGIYTVALITKMVNLVTIRWVALRYPVSRNVFAVTLDASVSIPVFLALPYPAGSFISTVLALYLSVVPLQ
jgi:hypothetical protein